MKLDWEQSRAPLPAHLRSTILRMDGSLQQAADVLNKAKHITVLTGAGVSKESGIPTFRDAMTGLWANYDPEKLATPEGFLNDPPLVWQWYDFRRNMVAQAEPNAGHYALAELAKKRRVDLITQNVDGLHAKAGSKDIIELHGNITRFMCFDRHHPIDDVPSGLPAPPTCPRCQSPIRPSVVWFGEALPPGALEKASNLASECDAMIVVGTSGLVHPAASLPFVVKRHGGTVIEVNPDVTAITNTADVFLRGQSGQILPSLISLVEASA
ncbi:MAG TPA: NAD-dependent deacylase [Candidatus Obscuribacterales bacterium]